MKYTSQQYAQALFWALQDKTARESEGIADNLFALMKKNRDFSLARKVIDIFKDYARRRRGIFSGELVSVRPLGEDNKFALVEKLIGFMLETRDVVVNKLLLEERQDGDLIGGCRVRVDNILIDMSISGALKKIRKQLSKN